MVSSKKAVPVLILRQANPMDVHAVMQMPGRIAGTGRKSLVVGSWSLVVGRWSSVIRNKDLGPKTKDQRP
jgi:hypothetical protein